MAGVARYGVGVILRMLGPGVVDRALPKQPLETSSHLVLATTDNRPLREQRARLADRVSRASRRAAKSSQPKAAGESLPACQSARAFARQPRTGLALDGFERGRRIFGPRAEALAARPAVIPVADRLPGIAMRLARAAAARGPRLRRAVAFV